MLLELIAEMLTLIAGLIVAYFVYILLTNRDDKPSTDSPTMAHTALREIVERAVDEARKLPSLGGSGEPGRPPEGRSVAEHSYEDLLATAILNKVIEKFQKEQVDGNSNVLHGKPVSAGKCATSEHEAGLDEGVEEGCSSLEPLSQDDYSSDCSASCFRHVRNQLEPTVSLMIEEQIEEVTTTYASDEEPKENDALPIRNAHRVPFPELGMDIIDPSQESSEDSQDEPDTQTTHIGLVSPVESWEENWLFQKKRVQTQADPVAMLVPNPSADFKALIGDKDAEDTSDLSECSSAQSDEEIEKELMEAINNVVPRSPTRAGFENDAYNGTETSNNNSKENHAEIVPRETWHQKNESLEKTERNEHRNHVENVQANGNDEAKEDDAEKQEKKMKEIETESMDIVDEDSRKIEIQEYITNGKFGENKIVRSKNKSESIEGFEINGSSSVEPLENLLDVPKTPASTPTWIFVPEKNFENTGDEGIVLREENVLNSLECAKKKLMAVNDDIIETFKEEEVCDQQKTDFPSEDIQQESEYTEHYDTATQRHLDSLTKLETSEQLKNSEENTESKCREAVANAKAESASHSSLRNKKSDEEVRLEAPPRPGTIAEREHKKWENAPPIQNNPYSEENIQKRLLERQYSRRSSDIPGIHTELPKSNGADLDVVLTPHEPDIKRFGRDYYINHSRGSSNEKGRRSAASTSSRPGSSLSQGSSSTGPDQDQQDETRYRETEALLNRSNDVKSKVAKWQNNNAESKYRSSDGSRIEHRQKTWEDERMEEILENERKNNKNEINAKLNNQEKYDNPVIETKKSNSEENPRKIKRIDLKAYGFENEFFSNGNKTIKTATPRVINKLDLKSFGYDGGIRRTQSNIQLNSIGNDDFKPRVVRVTNKSNLTRHRDYGNDLIETRASGDNNLTQSTEALNKFHGESYDGFGLKSAKSVPNIAKFYSNAIDNRDDEEVESYSQNSYDLGIVKNGSVKNIANNYNPEKCNKSSDCSIDESDDTDNSSEKEQRSKKILNREDFEKKVLPMPSVRRLAEAFSKQSEHGPLAVSKANKSSNMYKERSSTPEIQIVESPRQMHSLTARSLSKQFREGLRQISNKVTSPPASHVTMEQPKLVENQTEVVQAKNDTSNDINVILPGKLKSNIIFWEQMQRRS